MTSDPIFNAFATAEIVWAEIDRLVAALPSGFSPDLTLGASTEENLGDDWAYSRTGYHFKIHKLVGRQRLPSQLLFVFDLARPEIPSSWAHARRAFLTCAYAPKFDTGWEVDEVAIGMDGRPISEESRGCTRHADGRLLEWENADKPWLNRTWFFTVPLMAIDGHDALRKEVVDPIKNLLLHNQSPDDVLSGGSAIRYQV
ncbi:hypothetical protein E3C22_02690 [Jiella endophytica]|uniref:Uncharacterized protein n=1 Tax=Jiella endophytica TaxID=2558362 RepID=A0A4Y8RTS4_9HYPH|nr:hypothetical protein [Jiella endophytica]TFF27383.1 hypothetical protein E3C22_02690 [Jiella endophytica]